MVTVLRVVGWQAEWEFERACTLLEVNERITGGEDVALVQRSVALETPHHHKLSSHCTNVVEACAGPSTVSLVTSPRSGQRRA